jgi:hypothetical protein
MKSRPTHKGTELPRPKKRIFTPADFGEIIQNVPEDCPLVGGQAVAWWATQYHIPTEKPLTSCDIDFWGFRDSLQHLAKTLRRKPIYPHKYEMTAWVGGIPLQIKGEETIVEFINTVPGLDVINATKASVGQVFSSGMIPKNLLVLSPVSLVLAKLHALRAYDQSGRQDEMHLKVSLLASHAFIAELAKNSEIRQVLWNVERLIAASQNKPYQRLEAQHGFKILSAVPTKEIAQVAASTEISNTDGERLHRFLNQRWPRVQGAPTDNVH